MRCQPPSGREYYAMIAAMLAVEEGRTKNNNKYCM
jgi:hypothetical protein